MSNEAAEPIIDETPWDATIRALGKEVFEAAQPIEGDSGRLPVNTILLRALRPVYAKAFGNTDALDSLT